ncbi:NAD(P)-binding protein [Polyporus arcularius HHB13444]|uniref:NAD(P)-binding protein n=1 Tax=Polyporus arcularius HHB13444 TaxID=1314778 RepID=A0A5C3P6K9_9APHY|nr:NAD(P)-binding protein [Polyporus arcularius HHB13444]
MSVDPPALILVTGASGFVAAHIVVQLLDAGYRVRGTARGVKLGLVRDHFKSNPSFEAIQIDDIATSDFHDALIGVDAVLAVACPLSGKADPNGQLKGAYDGTLNLLRQTIVAGVHKVVVTSSFATLLDPSFEAAYEGIVLNERLYGQASPEDILAGDRKPFYRYCGAKILAEEAAWSFAEEHPELDLTTINPPFMYGGYAIYPGNGPHALGSTELIYQLIAGDGKSAFPPPSTAIYCNVRDAARAHLLALRLPKQPQGSDVRGKRFLVAAPRHGARLWTETVQRLAETRPELRDRLPKLEDAPKLSGPLSTTDSTQAREKLGMHDYAGWDATIDETVTALLELEKKWKGQT